ncbi:Na/Pi cotransporter family protein [Sneathiella sp. P13V-1]|uniref:Na/Pi cotransporter family protein n=1 Tax=Sneathiella sp. P13V-1 TaxID=2697366 RepID=UPI001D114A14|nr:Na/Pi symporter [Sneathiella sp. P13V-1]
MGTVFGGLGLFLLAINMMTDGLKLAAGPSLKGLLSNWSNTPLKGVFAGCLMTALVQSSSAVTVASLGFVNAGLISMYQAFGIIYGANVGTTMTGWLVALVGFKISIQAFAWPMIGLGMVFRLLKPQGRLAAVGLALVGFGLFFVGIDLLRSSFEGVVQAFDISKLTATGISGIATFLLVGVFLTILTQSSSASIALTITAASSGLIGLYAAGAMVIGANIGTTSTALIASIGATANAKRVAAAQVVFNGLTAIVALIILPILFFIIESLTVFLSIDASPAISLAIFHTLFNILGVLLIFPQNERLANFMKSKFRSVDEIASQPKYLDKTIAQTPDLAVQALLMEIQSISERVFIMFRSLLPPNKIDLFKCEKDVSVLRQLSSEVSRFVVSIERSSLNEETISALAKIMRVQQYFISCTAAIGQFAHLNVRREKLELPELEREYQAYLAYILDLFSKCQDIEFCGSEEFEGSYEELQLEYDAVKANLVLNATQKKISVTQMSETIDCLNHLLLSAQQWHKAFRRIHVLHMNGDTLGNSVNEQLVE